jgi:hypothetical protein
MSAPQTRIHRITLCENASNLQTWEFRSTLSVTMRVSRNMHSLQNYYATRQPQEKEKETNNEFLLPPVGAPGPGGQDLQNGIRHQVTMFQGLEKVQT